jgi:hypothetical protein
LTRKQIINNHIELREPKCKEVIPGKADRDAKSVLIQKKNYITNSWISVNINTIGVAVMVFIATFNNISVLS